MKPLSWVCAQLKIDCHSIAEKWEKQIFCASHNFCHNIFDFFSFSKALVSHLLSSWRKLFAHLITNLGVKEALLRVLRVTVETFSCPSFLTVPQEREKEAIRYNIKENGTFRSATKK